MNKSFHLYLCLIGQQQGKCPSTNYKGIDKSNPEGKSFINPLSPKSDQHQFSPNNVKYILKRKAYEN